MLGDDIQAARKRATAAIHAYVGANGDGKTLAAVHDTMPGLDRGRPCLSTVPLLDWRALCETCGKTPCSPLCPKPQRPVHPMYVPLESLSQLLEWKSGDILLDEVQGVASAREHNSLPYQIANVLRKLRHMDARLRWTAPDWEAPDAVIRRVTKAVTLCHGGMAVTSYKACEVCGRAHRRPLKTCKSRSEPRLWRDNRVFRYRTYDARQFTEFSTSRAESTQKTVKLRVMARQRYIRSKGLAQYAYDTHGDVISLGSADMAGVCIVCGGTRTRKKCSCADHERPAGITVRDFQRQQGEDEAGAA
jgi:hypothetical protein